MGKFHLTIGYLLGLFCAASFAVPALAGTLSVDVSPTTGYVVTNRTTTALPPKATSGPIATYNPTLGPLAGGGAYQTTSSGITITAIDQTPHKTTMSGRVMAGASAMKNGMKRCLTSMRCNLALAAGAAGLQALLDGVDWVMNEGGQVSTTQTTYPDHPVGDSVYTPGVRLAGQKCSWIDQPLPYVAQTDPSGHRQYTIGCRDGGQVRCGVQGGQYLTGFVENEGCYVSSNPNDAPKPVTLPVSPDDIRGAIDTTYIPDPSDLPFLTGGLDWSAPDVNFEVLDIPSITGANSPTYIEHSDGTTTGTYSEFDFSWSGPSKQPTVDVEERHHEDKFGPAGEPLGSTTTSIVSSGSPAPLDVPTDCDFMPTVCRFIDWFTEPDPDLSQEIDFSQLIDDVEVDREFSVGSSTAACPAPFVIDLAWVPSVEVSLQPFCDFADLLRPVLLAIASIFSGMIILRT